jgi:hypothetical protein
VAVATAFRSASSAGGPRPLLRCSVRRPVLLLAVTLVGGLTGGGCASVGDPCAALVAGTATYVSGSTPPPYHVEWTVRLEDSTGTVTFSPGYGSHLSWSATFTPEDASVTESCRRLRRLSGTATATGGGTLTVRWQGVGGRPTRLTSADPLAADLVRTAVPAAAWSQARGGYERWQQSQRR